MIKNINNNKIIMITHIADIDGMGSLILAKKYYDKLDYVLCEINELMEVFSSVDFTNYEIIYVCDLALSNTILNYLNNHPEITNKINHFDHHEKFENSPEYVNSIVYLNDKPTCSTELFYNYLLALDSKFNKEFYKTYVEATREQDNFDFGDEEYNAKLLAFTHALIGPENYIELICNLNDNENFKLPKIYEDLYKSDLDKQKEYIDFVNKNLCIADYNNYKVGITISEQYRSIVGNSICKLRPEIDFMLIINFNRNRVSLRSVKNNIDLNVIGKEFHPDGGGHKLSAGFLIDSLSIPKLKQFIDLYVKNLTK